MDNKKTSRFTTFKANESQKEVTKKTAQQLKNKLLLLANEMLKNKQINNAAFKGMEKQTYSRTRIDTLEESLSTLKSIKDQFKVNEAQTRTTKNNSKKFTAKDVKQHKMELKADELTEYNVYIKYISYVEAAKKDNVSVEFLEEMRKTSIGNKASENSGTTIELKDGETVRVYGHTNHETIKVKGMRHIRGELKRFLKSIFEMPYVLKADIIHVVVNKMMLDEAQYRWLGGVRKAKISEDVKYFKAWNAGFTYHKYDLDINDETPHECVPNALFKMYGNRENKGFIASISNGGLEYVRNKLDGYVMQSNNGLDDDLDFGVDEHDQKTGYTSEQILNFCNEHKLRCYGYDWKMQQFITNKNSDLKFNNDNLPAFVFYLNDQHVYLIQDKEMRHALLHSNDKSDIISILAKEQDKNNKGKERTIEVDLPFNMWDTVSDTTIFITQNRVVHDIFYKLACQGEVYNKKLKMNEKEGIVRFMYKTNTIIYNPDYHAVNTTIARLGENYTFKNQRLNSLAKEYFEKESYLDKTTSDSRIMLDNIVPYLLKEIERNELGVYIYGTTNEVMNATDKYLAINYPEISNKNYYSPPFRELTNNEKCDVIEQINESGAHIVLVVLGCPKQEKWMSSMHGKINACMIGIGGALPVVVGVRKKAPNWMRNSGLEWIFRLVQEPRRLFMRYAISNSLYILLFSLEIIKNKWYIVWSLKIYIVYYI